MKPFLTVFLALLIGASAARGQIRVSGSDLLSDTLGVAIAAYAESRGLPVEVDLAGSYTAAEMLQRGQTDIALLAVPLGQDAPAGAHRSVVLAHKVVAVAVPPTNPLTQISLPQLAAVFGDAEASSISRWGQLDLTGEWASRSIAMVTVSRATHGLTLDLFRHSVLQGPTFRRAVSQLDGVERIRQRLEQDNSVIALLPTIPANRQGMKLLAISPGGTQLAQPPNPDVIEGGLYPLRLPFYLSFPLLRAGELRDILRFLLSEEAAEAISKSGLIPLTEASRQRLALEFERL